MVWRPWFGVVILGLRVLLEILERMETRTEARIQKES